MLKEIKRKHEEELLNKKNVWAVSIGYKESESPIKNIINKIKKALGIKSIRVYVEKKESKNKLDEIDLVPKKIEGVKTDVKEDTPIRFINEISDYREKYRPVKAGISMCNAASTACSSGIPVYKIIDDKVRTLANVNNHCQNMIGSDITRKGDPIIQPSLFDGGDPEEDQVGEVYDFYERRTDRKNIMDSGLNLLYEDVEMTLETLDKKPVPEIENLKLGQKVWKSGRTTGYTEAEVIDIDVTVSIKNNQGNIMYFKDQVFTTGELADGGDSSSVVFSQKNNKIVAQLFAKGGGIVAITPYQRIKDYFDFYLTKEEAEAALESGGQYTYAYIADGWNSLNKKTIFDDERDVEAKITTYWGMKVRKNPSVDSEKIGKVKNGEVVKIVDYIEGSRYNWYKIKYNK